MPIFQEADRIAVYVKFKILESPPVVPISTIAESFDPTSFCSCRSAFILTDLTKISKAESRSLFSLADVLNLQNLRMRSKTTPKPPAITVCCLLESTGKLSKDELIQNA